MSHARVAVLLKEKSYNYDYDVYNQLAKYDERLAVEFKPLDMEEYAKRLEELKNDKDTKATHENMTVEELVESYWYKKNDEGIYGYWYNPDARYDYYSVIGVSEEDLIMPYEELKKIDEDIDFDCLPIKYYKIVEEFNDEQISNIKTRYEELCKDGDGFYTNIYYIEQYPTFEEYLVNCQINAPYAFVADGIWYERGKLGWFAMSDETAESRKDFLKLFLEKMEEYKDGYIVWCDYHI